MNLLVCGGAGFIGSHFARLAVQSEKTDLVVVLDALTYAGNYNNFHDFESDPKFQFEHGQIQNAYRVNQVIRKHGITHIVNFAAESHNDRSLLEAGEFIQTDVFGVYVLLQATRENDVTRFVQVSTDEVYGTTDSESFTEASPVEPNTPYSASKAGGDLQVRAHVTAYGTPAIITRGGNTYGPYQYPEKLIPFFVTRLMEGKKAPLYGEGTQVREWIHALDHASGVWHVLEHGSVGEIYNIGDVNERENREVVKILLEQTGRDESFIKKIEDPRKGAHDKRYSMKSDKLRALGWETQVPFEDGLAQTVEWYKENRWWWEPILESTPYEEFVTRFYGPYLGEDL